MELEKKINISNLLSYYGNLLTEKQFTTMQLYYDFDVSLNEIAEQFSITKQAVRDNILRAEKLLHFYEGAIKLESKTKDITNLTSGLINLTDNENIIAGLNKILEILEVG